MKRMGIRLLSLGVAVILALQLLPWRPAAAVFLSASPLLSLGGALAARAITGWTLLGLPVLVLAFFRSRWFCRWICPVGLAAETVGKWNRRQCRQFVKWPPLGRWLLAGLLGASVAGFPLVLWVDPLAIFNGFFSSWRTSPGWSVVPLAAGLPIVLLISWRVPQLWCHRLCPLGALQDVLAGARHRWHGLAGKVPASTSFSVPINRRAFLGLVTGGLAAMALRRVVPAAPPPLRPPGARAEDQFAGLCARCGACIRACPYHILRPDFGRGGFAGLLAPIVSYSKGYCFEYCHECTQVCPTGAIERLTLEAKRNLPMGLAHVHRDSCLAWNNGEYCMVCQEFCPYLAIDTVRHREVNCPVVKADHCRGCGACELNCPAIPEKAIVVHPLEHHRR